MSTKKIQMTIESRLVHVPLIGAALRGLCHASGLPPEDCQGIELCVTEAVVNCIEHAYGREPAHEVAVTIQDDGARIVIAVRDNGRPMATDMLQRKKRRPMPSTPPKSPASQPPAVGWPLSRVIWTASTIASKPTETIW